MGGEKEKGRVLTSLICVSRAAELTSKSMSSAQSVYCNFFMPQSFLGALVELGKEAGIFSDLCPEWSKELAWTSPDPRVPSSVLHPHILEVLRDSEREGFL